MGLASITNNILTDTGITPSGVISGTLGTGQVAYGSAANTIAGSANFTWDNATSIFTIGGTTTSDSGVLYRFVGSATNSRLGVYDTAKRGIYIGSTAGYAGVYGYDYTTGAAVKLILQEFGGNVSIGSTTDGGQRLQVYGDTLLRGSGNTSATTALTVQNSDSNALLRTSNSGELAFGTIGSTIIAPADIGTGAVLLGANARALLFRTEVGTGLGYQFYFSNSNFAGGSGQVGGTNGVINITSGFRPASGGGIFNTLLIGPTINQTGGANGITRGLYVNPTLTSAADFRAIEWSNNAATAPSVSWGLYGAGTAPNYMAGTLGIGAGASVGYNFVVARNITGSVESAGIRQYGAVLADVSTVGIGIRNQLNVGAGVALNSYQHYRADVFSFGAGATLVTQIGFLAENTLTNATNNYGFYGNIAAATGRWNLYMAGTAANYLNGNTIIGGTDTDDGINKLQVTGNAKITGAISVGSGPSDFAGTMRTTNSTVPATGAGLEFGYLTGTSTGVIVSYNRGTTAYTALTINASTLNLNTGSNGTVNFGTGNAVIPGKIRSGASSGTSAYINIGINNVSEAQLNLATSTFTPTSPVNGDLWFNGTDVKFRISGVTTNFITGALTSGYVPKATGTSSIANSLVYDNGTSVLVNTNTAIPTPTTGTYSHAFQVLANAAGGMIISTTNTASGIGIVNSSSTNKTWDISPFGDNLAINESGVGARMYFLSGGNITVGGITNSGNLLEVLGTFKTTGVNTLSNLGGVGSRMVVADANGVLSTQAIPGGTLSGSGVAGQVTYWSGASSLTGDNNFFWDSVNGNLGIGINTPTRKIDILTNANNSQLVNIRNNSTGTSSVAGFQAQNSTQTASLFLTSTGYTTNGVIAANTMTLYSANASNIAIAVNSTGYFSIGTGNVTPTEKLRMFNNGNVLIQDGGVYNDGGERLQVIGRAIANNSVTQGAFGTGNRIALFGSQTIDVPTVGPFNQGTVTAAGTSAQYMTFNGNTTIGGDALVAGSVHINSVQFATTGTITMADSATNKPRTLSVMQLQMQKAGTIGGTITKGSTLYLFGVYPTTSTGGTVTFTEYAGLRIGNLTEWTGGTPPNTTVDLTNRWGIYQEGDTDPNYFAGSVGIGVATNNASAKLQVNSTTQGFLPPRMTTAQRNAIATPAAGLIVYDTDLNIHYGYNGTTWNAFY